MLAARPCRLCQAAHRSRRFMPAAFLCSIDQGGGKRRHDRHVNQWPTTTVVGNFSPPCARRRLSGRIIAASNAGLVSGWNSIHRYRMDRSLFGCVVLCVPCHAELH